MSVVSFLECNCRCHIPGEPAVKHFMACCSVCPECGRNIVSGMLNIHLNQHKEQAEAEAIVIECRGTCHFGNCSCGGFNVPD